MDKTFENYVDYYKNYQWPVEGVFPFKGALDTRYGNSNAKVADYFETFTGDCKDTGSGAAAVNPVALEILGDDEDQDCDVQNESSIVRRDTASFNFAISAQDFSVTTPTRPLVAVADEHYIVFSQVAAFTYGSTTRTNVGLAFYLDRNDTSVSEDGALSSVLPAYGYESWFDGGTTQAFNGDILGVAVNGSDFTVGFSYVEANQTRLVMRQYIHSEGINYTFDASKNERSSVRSGNFKYTSGDFQFDASLGGGTNKGRFIAVACGPDGGDDEVAQLMVVDPTEGELGSNFYEATDEDWQTGSSISWSQCFIQTNTYAGVNNRFYVGGVDSSGDVNPLGFLGPNTITGPYSLASNPWSSFSLQAPAATTNENLIIFHEDSNEMTIEYNADDSVQVSIPGGSAVRLKQADAMYLDDTLYVAAVYKLGTGGTPRIAFAYGEPNSLNWITDYPVFSSDKTDMTPMVPQGVGLAVDEERVILAVTAEKDGDDYLGWAVMGPAED